MSDEDAQLELVLAQIMWPSHNVVWLNLSNSWTLAEVNPEDAEWPGIVPQWTKSNDACPKLMLKMNKFPISAYAGICYTCCGRIIHESFSAHAGDKERALRIATIKAAICGLRTKDD